jgi:hypothetical protein
LVSPLLVVGDGGEPVPEVAFCIPGHFQTLLVVGGPALGGGDGVAVVAAPVAPACFVESGLAVGQRPLGVVSGS